MIRLYERLYMPICRAYSRHVLGDKPADGIMRVLWSLHFWKIHGYWPRLDKPRTFEEKVSCRMLFDRNPRWTMFSDKWRVRDYVAARIGGEHLVPLLYHCDRPEDIPFDELPTKFVIKANHGSGYNILVEDKSKLDRQKVIVQLTQWLQRNFCHDNLVGAEWVYRNIKPVIIVEAFLEDEGDVPRDYKFFCFSGRVEFLQINFDRFGDASEKFFDREFNPLDLWNGRKQYRGEVVRPERYEEMVRLAEALSQDVDFIRVDLYSVGGRIYFGELTCCPAAADIEFVPRSYDFAFGEKWK